MDDFSHGARIPMGSLAGRIRLARNVLYLKGVFIMKYAQFHTLYGALKERVGSVKELKTR
jgi:hypothetical protein